VIGIENGNPKIPSGSFGFMIDAYFSDQANNHGFSLVGVMNFDGLGNVSGPYTAESGAGDQPANSVSGTFTGISSTNPDGTGSVTVALDIGIAIKFATVLTDGGKGFLLALSTCTGSCDISGTVVRGVARSIFTGPLTGSYGFLLNSSPGPSETLGVMNFDGSGNLTMSYKSFIPGGNPNQPPVSSASLTGTYSLNSDGTGMIQLPAQPGQPVASAFAIVTADAGSQILLVKTDGTAGSNVFSGAARLQ
jgi:hypothetical protein